LKLLQAWSRGLPGRRASDIVQELTERTPMQCAKGRARGAAKD
jgi:hypothetical protein